MEVLKEIYDSDIGSENSGYHGRQYRVRKAVRAIVFNDNKEIAVLSVDKHNFHKLPGGGMEDGETQMQALKRELIEEVGCKAEITGELGMTIEFRNEHNLVQISYVYIANVDGDISSPNFTEGEASAGFNVKWMDLDSAIEKFEKDDPSDYPFKFMKHRDLFLLRKMKSTIKE